SICSFHVLRKWLQVSEKDVPLVRADGNVMKPLFYKTIKGKSTPLSIVPSHFTPRSLRSAASSAAIDDGVPMEKVLMQGRWSSKEMFKKFYYRATGRSRKRKS